MAAELAVRKVADRDEWEALFAQVAQPHLAQSWAYGDAVAAAVDWRLRRRALDAGGWRPQRLVFERAGAPIAICQILQKPLGRIPLAGLLDRGPLLLGPEPDIETTRAVYTALRAARRQFGLGLILVPALLDEPQNHELLSAAGFRPRHVGGYRSTRVDLSVDEDAMFKNLKSKWRNQYRGGMKSSPTITVSSSPEDAEWMVDRHIQNMREKGFDSPEPALVRALYEAAPNSFIVCRAVLDGDSVAGWPRSCSATQPTTTSVGSPRQPARRTSTTSCSGRQPWNCDAAGSARSIWAACGRAPPSPSKPGWVAPNIS